MCDFTLGSTWTVTNRMTGDKQTRQNDIYLDADCTNRTRNEKLVRQSKTPSTNKLADGGIKLV